MDNVQCTYVIRAAYFILKDTKHRLRDPTTLLGHFGKLANSHSKMHRFYIYAIHTITAWL